MLYKSRMAGGEIMDGCRDFVCVRLFCRCLELSLQLAKQRIVTTIIYEIYFSVMVSQHTVR